MGTLTEGWLGSLQAAVALGERDELKTQLAASETTPTVSTPTPQHNDVIALQQRIVKLQQQLTEGAPVTSDLQRELAEKSVGVVMTS